MRPLSVAPGTFLGDPPRKSLGNLPARNGEPSQEISWELSPDLPGKNSWDMSQEHCRERVPACRPCHLQHERSCLMTLIALTQCCRLLAIDGKTLRRWLAQSQLPVQAHPSDARCKGLARDHLLLLARTHHRRLAGLPEEWPAPAPAATGSPPASPELSAELITALETLSALPAQIAALQQQLADLTALVQPHPPQPAVTLPHPQQRAARVGAPTPTRASARSRP